jgi:hypothetical protein
MLVFGTIYGYFLGKRKWQLAKRFTPFEWIRCDTFKNFIIVVVEAFVAGHPRRKGGGRGKAQTRTSATTGQTVQTIVRL